MAFKAKRIRIQIPCGGSGSVVDLERMATTTTCDGGCSDSPQSAVCPPPKAACEVSDMFRFNPWDEVVQPAQPTLLAPEDLPLFKRELELKIKMLRLADDASALAQERVKSKLADLARAEEELRKELDDGAAPGQ